MPYVAATPKPKAFASRTARASSRVAVATTPINASGGGYAVSGNAGGSFPRTGSKAPHIPTLKSTVQNLYPLTGQRFPFTSRLVGMTGGGALGNRMTNEIPTGAINGLNTTFITNQAFQIGSTAVYLNGQRLLLGSTFDYIEQGQNQIVLVSAPLVGDVVLVDYVIA